MTRRYYNSLNCLVLKKVLDQNGNVLIVDSRQVNLRSLTS